ncbi:CDP-glycerol glycerophosphotransferase family protein [Alkalicoccobacillus gibsonii]|uniref:CDP-glycerol glycerophosphotransferase family protein n=1 Tax=Alkalicoccobacillus gibsonii TaxID=79881 RepID=UPI003F7C7EEB
MKSIYCKHVTWDGEYLRFTLDLSKEDNLSKEISVFGRKTKQIKHLDFSIQNIEEGIYFEVNVKQLRTLKADRWDFQLKSKNNKKWRKLVLENFAPLSQKLRYFEPIVQVNSARSLSFFISDKNVVSIHSNHLGMLEEKTYNVVTYSKEIALIKDNERELKFKIDMSYDGDEIDIILKNEFNEVYRIPTFVSYGIVSVIKENFVSLKGKWTFYFQKKRGRTLEQTKVFIYNNDAKTRNHFKKQTYEVFPMGLDSTIIIPVEEPDRPLNIIYGELSIEKFKFLDDKLIFNIQLDQTNYFDSWDFFLKQSNSEEKLYLDKEYRVFKDNIEISLSSSEYYLIAAKNSRWNLHAEINRRDYIEVRRVGEYQTSLPTKSERYKGYTKINKHLCIVPQITKTHSIQVSFMPLDHYHKLTSPAEVSIKNLSIKKGEMKLKIVLGLTNKKPIQLKGLKLIQRRDPNNYIDLTVENINKLKNNRVEIITIVDLANLPLEPFYWDFFALISVDKNELRHVRIYSDNYLVIKKLRHLFFKYTLKNRSNYLTYPYLTVNGGLSITYRKMGEFENLKNKLTEYLAFSYYHVIYKWFARENIWLIHEKYSETAQDNGYYFFSYMYNNHYNKKVYYVIKKGTKDESNLNEFKDRTVYFMSFKHLVLLISSKIIISSEAKVHGYAWRVTQGVIRDYLNSKKFVFLQHGVLGLKKVDNTFDFNTQNSAELFVASSNYEKQIIKKHFGYKDDHVIVTGLPRWDVLEDKSHQLENEKKEILMMPTWRNWLDEVEEEEFVKSDYYSAYNTLLNSNSLHECLKKNSLLLNFYVHPKFMPYVTNFTKNNDNIKIIEFGEVKVNELLMRSSLLITDYSSVSWEMYYQKKPVLFYHFDLAQYIKYQGSYMDMNQELFGDTVFDNDSLINSINYYSKVHFKEDQKYVSQRNQFFQYMDNKNSERIYKEILLKEKEINKKDLFTKSIKESDLMKVLWRKYKSVNFMKHIRKRFLKA